MAVSIPQNDLQTLPLLTLLGADDQHGTNLVVVTLLRRAVTGTCRLSL
jgi:hypothetical protein